MFSLITFIAFLLAPSANAKIAVDFNCTQYNGTTFVYTPSAVACDDFMSEKSCHALYPESKTDPTFGWPDVGLSRARPLPCYTSGSATTGQLVQEMKSAALALCPKTCGYCCNTDAYSCPNVQFPRLNCNTITKSQCDSIEWRTIIATDCPSACGFCNQGGCVDAVTNCANDLSICNTVSMQDFVNTYCQRTCGRCPSTTTSVISSECSETCTSYIADTSTGCAAWASNGFCTNSFYTNAQRRARCATTCRIC